MKYARTIGGMLNYIINLEKWCKEDFGYILWMDRGYRTLQNYNIVKQADTIEELCDGFVVVFEDKNHIVYSQFKWAMDKAMWSGMPFMIYGAIWTDKGLIYVAKMNNKGVMELL